MQLLPSPSSFAKAAKAFPSESSIDFNHHLGETAQPHIPQSASHCIASHHCSIPQQPSHHRIPDPCSRSSQGLRKPLALFITSHTLVSLQPGSPPVLLHQLDHLLLPTWTLAKSSSLSPPGIRTPPAASRSTKSHFAPLFSASRSMVNNYSFAYF